MKRRALIRHLTRNGCRPLREGRRHSLFLNPETQSVSTIPRHGEIDDFLVRKICRDLDVPEPGTIR